MPTIVERSLWFSMAATTLVLLLSVPASGQDRPDFAGTWVLNRDKSDQIQGGGVGATQLVVAQEEATLTVVQEGGRGQGETILEPGAGPQDYSTERSSGTVEAAWEDSHLVVKRIQVRETPRGSREIQLVTRWELSEDGTALTHRVLITSPRGERSLTLVYDKQH